jgi:hypothetical protein
MNILRYNELDAAGLEGAYERTVERLRAGDFRGADVRKLAPGPYYRAKLSDADRLLFRFARYDGATYLLLLEVIRNHAYEKSRFLKGAAVDEAWLEPVPDPSAVPAPDHEDLSYANPARPHFHVLDKILSFDELQHEAFGLRPPLILIGSAGSGKTVLTLEKLKQLSGDILYVTHSAYLAENARNLYYAFNYENEAQNVEFLSYKEYLETLRVPDGKPMTFRAFARWFSRHSQTSRIKDAHKVFEEFHGVLTGGDIRQPYLSREDYLSRGVRRSIFGAEERDAVYGHFLKYLEFLEAEGFYDLNLAAHAALPLCRPAYDCAVVDEVQDLTNVQLYSILQSLRAPDQFVLCGDANQIVHPNFFSWSALKKMFYEERPDRPAEIVRVLNANYRNSAQVTDIANRLLRIKHARFGSIDRESNFLVRSATPLPGSVELLAGDEGVTRDLDQKTRRSARYAVVCLRPEDKDAVRRHFQTPLLFSVQEAKGLEYENAILWNFVSGSPREFQALVEGVGPEDLAGDLAYARARDKADKALEVYKFYVNALYVAMTRAVRNLYIVEREPGHRLLALLGLGLKRGSAGMAAQQSSAAEWKEEARKLELQGKHEQAEAIRRDILAIQPVPWRVLTPSSLADLEREAFDPERFNKQAKQLIYEYAVACHVPWIFARLVALKFNRAREPWRDEAAVERKYAQDCLERSLHALRRQLDRHGLDFRNPLNQTPLMIAAQIGRADLVNELVAQGAGTRLRDNWGRTPLQIALRASFRSADYARSSIGAVYDALAPTSVNVKVGGRLVKLDKRQMEYFLLNAMMALLQDIVRIKIEHRIPAFETRDFVQPLAHFPEQVIPERRRRREYLSSVLARNEVRRPEPYNRQLFLRVAHGLYMINPLLEIEAVEDEWVNVYDLVHIDALERETDNGPLLYFCSYIRSKQRSAAEARRAPASPDAAESASSPPESGPAAGAAAPPPESRGEAGDAGRAEAGPAGLRQSRVPPSRTA